MKLLGWLILPPLAVLMIAFAIANRQLVTIDFNPLPFTLDLPVFILVYLGVLIGLVAGGVIEWAREYPIRSLARRQRKELLRQEAEVSRLKSEQKAAAEPAPGEARRPRQLESAA